MRIFSKIALAITLATGQPVAAQDKQFLVVMDTSIVFTMLNVEEAETLRRNALGVLAERAKRDRDMKLDFIDTTYGRNVLSIYAGDYIRGGAKRALDATAINPSACSNLTSAFDQLAYAARISTAKEIHMVVVSPLLHTGVSCPSFDPYTPPPSEISVEGIFENDNIASISFLGVADEQIKQWDAKFRPIASEKDVQLVIETLNASNAVVRGGRLPW